MAANHVYTLHNRTKAVFQEQKSKLILVDDIDRKFSRRVKQYTASSLHEAFEMRKAVKREHGVLMEIYKDGVKI